jgi:PqqD family protein of HPr-rel-A system
LTEAAESTNSRYLLRRLDDAAVVFDTRTWQTHVLPPAAAAIADLANELAETGPVPARRLATAIQDELHLDLATPEMRELLRMFVEIGILDE